MESKMETAIFTQEQNARLNLNCQFSILALGYGWFSCHDRHSAEEFARRNSQVEARVIDRFSKTVDVYQNNYLIRGYII